jgi:hypothetical protein
MQQPRAGRLLPAASGGEAAVSDRCQSLTQGIGHHESFAALLVRRKPSAHEIGQRSGGFCQERSENMWRDGCRCCMGQRLYLNSAALLVVEPVERGEHVVEEDLLLRIHRPHRKCCFEACCCYGACRCSSDTAGEKVPTGGELTLFEAVDPGAGLTSFCCVARRRPGMFGVT